MAYFDFLQNIFAKKKDGGDAGNEPAKLPGLTVGRTMKLVLEHGKDEDELLLSTSFDGFDENGLLIVNAPVYKGNVYPLPLGGIYPVMYRVHRNNYRMRCRAAESYSEGGLHFLLLELVSLPEKLERRNDYRLPVKFPCGMTRFVPGDDGEPVPVPFKATMLDLSVGGAQLLIPVNLARGEEVGCAVALGEYGEMDFTLAVRWIVPVPESLDPAYRAGLRFMRLTNSDENILMRYIFNQQFIRRRARRGM